MLAIGNVAYGKMAYNAAVRVKHLNPDVNIHLLYSKDAVSHLPQGWRGFFTYTDEIEKEHYTHNSVFNPAKAKLNMYKYLRFDYSYFVDVDTVCIKDPSPLFQIEKPFAIEVLGQGMTTDKKAWSQMLWATPQTLNKYFGEQAIAFTNSSFQIMKKDAVNEVYDLANEYFNSGLLKVKDLRLKWGGYLLPDELFINLALGKLNRIKESHVKTPIYFRFKNDGSELKKVEKIVEDYYFIGFSGSASVNMRYLIGACDTWLEQSFKASGLQHNFRLLDLLKRKIYIQ